MSRITDRSVLLLTVVALAAPATGQLLKLTTGSGGGERQPVISADGKTVAYVAMRGGTRELFTVPVDGGTATARTIGKDVSLGYGTFESWPSISISTNARYLAYWNATGVRLIDTVTKTDTIVAPVYQIPYPSIDPSGGRIVWQAPVTGQQEVFVRALPTGTPKRVTSTSGTGRRLPVVHGDLVLFQKTVSGWHELFLHDLKANTTKQLTKNSGPGNRYGRFAPGGASVVYEAIAGGCKEVFVHDLSSDKSTQVTTLGSIGDRLPAPSGDRQLFFQTRGQTMELLRADDDGKNVVTITTGSGGGLRRPSTDPHGHVVVFQATATSGPLEVFRHRFCPEGTRTRYGQHDKPSVGKLESLDDWYRCEMRTGIGTSLPRNTVSVWSFGVQQTAIKIPGTGSHLYTLPLVLVPVALDGQGDAWTWLPIPQAFKGTFYYQWFVLDAAANAAGIVGSEGTKASF